MKRHTLALTVLLAAMATPLLTVGSARCQSGLPPHRDRCEICPLLEEYSSDYLYHCEAEIAEAEYDEQLDPRFDPETGRYVGHDEVKPIEPAVEATVASEAELEDFYTGYDDTYDAEVYGAYTSEAVVETVEEADADRYNEEYYADDNDYDYEYEEYDYDYEASDYWYEDEATVDPIETEVAEVPEVVAEESVDETYDYGYDDYDNYEYDYDYDYEYETYDYEAYDYEAEAEAANVPPAPPAVDPEVLAAEDAAAEESLGAEAWDYEAEGYDPYEYDYEAYEYDYEVYENGAVATPVEVDQELTSENEADFAETRTDSETDVEEDYSYDDYEYDYDYEYEYGYDYEADYVYEDEAAEETSETITPVVNAVSRQAMLTIAGALDNVSSLLKSASQELERTAALESNLR